MLKKLWGYIAAFAAGIISLLYIKSQYEHFEDESPQDSQVDKIKEDIEEIDKKIEKVKEKGVEDKKPQEEINYWKEN